MEQYKLLFDNGGEDSESFEQDKRFRTKEEADSIAREQSVRKWNWELLLWNISNKDITKYELILNMNYIQILNNLSMKKELNIKD